MNTRVLADKAAAKAKQQADGVVDIPLSKPLNLGGTKVTSLRMREPLLGDQLAAQASVDSPDSPLMEVTLFANLCQVAVEELQRLPMRDYVKVQQAYSGFID